MGLFRGAINGPGSLGTARVYKAVRERWTLDRRHLGSCGHRLLPVGLVQKGGEPKFLGCVSCDSDFSFAVRGTSGFDRNLLGIDWRYQQFADQVTSDSAANKTLETNRR
jgi:hypothetical protein